jgi:hypothetical protein
MDDHSSDNNAAIQFRPGEGFGRLLDNYGLSWGVSKNEAAKRLALLAANGFDGRYYNQFDRLAGFMGGPTGFVRACEQVRVALDTKNRALQESGQEAMAENDRAHFIRNTVNLLVMQFELEQAETRKRNQKQRVYIHRRGD